MSLERVPEGGVVVRHPVEQTAEPARLQVRYDTCRDMCTPHSVRAASKFFEVFVS